MIKLFSYIVLIVLTINLKYNYGIPRYITNSCTVCFEINKCNGDSNIIQGDKKRYAVFLSLSSIYNDLHSVFVYNLFWVPALGYYYQFNKKNAVDLYFSFPIQARDLFGEPSEYRLVYGLKLKSEYKRFLYKSIYCGINVIYIYNRSLYHFQYEDDILFSRSKIMIVPKLGILPDGKIYVDMSMGSSFGYSLINLIRNNGVEQKLVEDFYQNQLNKELKILSFFELNVGYRF